MIDGLSDCWAHAGFMKVAENTKTDLVPCLQRRWLVRGRHRGRTSVAAAHANSLAFSMCCLSLIACRPRPSCSRTSSSWWVTHWVLASPRSWRCFSGQCSPSYGALHTAHPVASCQRTLPSTTPPERQSSCRATLTAAVSLISRLVGCVQVCGTVRSVGYPGRRHCRSARPTAAGERQGGACCKQGRLSHTALSKF